MTLRFIVAALGGELYDGGRRASVSAPGHSAADRSASLMLDRGRVVVHGFGAADWRSVLDDLRGRGLIDEAGRPLGGEEPVGSRAIHPLPTLQARAKAAHDLWAEGVSIGGGVAARHLRHRAVFLDPGALDDLRLHPAAPVAVYRGRGRVRPALMAAVRDMDGALVAVELTYLDPSGRLATGLRLPRKTIGVLPPGCAVRLAEPARAIVVGEGVITTLSAMARFGLPGWAALAAHNLARWTPPAGVRSLVIAADRGATGERAASRLRARAHAAGLLARTALPPEPFGDWNEAAAGGARAEREGVEGRRDDGDGSRSARLEIAP